MEQKILFQIILATAFVVLNILLNRTSALTCWNAKCTWNVTAGVRTNCTYEYLAQCTGQYCVSYLLNSTIEAIQCLDYLPVLSGITSCDNQDKCICSTTIPTIACPNATAPDLALVSGGQAYTIYANENTPSGNAVATFRSVSYSSSVSVTLAINSASSTSFGTYFYLSGSSLLVNNTFDYETLYATGLSVFTVAISAATGTYTSTTTFTVSIADVDEQPTYCTDALGNIVANNSARAVYVSSSTLPITATVDADKITCTDPDQINANYRVINASLTNFLSTFTTPCNPTVTNSTVSNQCILRAAIGTEFYYNLRSSYQPVWIITQAGSSFSLTTTASIVVNYTNPGLSFNSTMPTTISYIIYNWPTPLPQEIFNFAIWTNRAPYQTNLNYTFCNASCTSTAASCYPSPYFSISPYTGKLSLTSSIVNNTNYAGCVWLTDGVNTVSKSVTLALSLNQPPDLTVLITTDIGYQVPVVTLSEITVATITPTSATATRFIFYIASFYYDYDSQAFRLDSTNTTATVVMRPFIPVSTTANMMTIKIIAVGSTPSVETVAFAIVNISKTNSNYKPYIDTAPIASRITPGQFSDNQPLAEFHVYTYRGSAFYYSPPYYMPETPTVSFNRNDMIYAVVSETESPTVLHIYWYKYQVRLYSLPGTRFDFGPFSITMTVTDDPGNYPATAQSYTMNIVPIDTYLARDSILLNFCFVCDSCDIAFVGIPQRCAINETFCCTHSLAGSRTSRYCSNRLDTSSYVVCCQGKLCNHIPSSMKQAASVIILLLGIIFVQRHILKQF